MSAITKAFVIVGQFRGMDESSGPAKPTDICVKSVDGWEAASSFEMRVFGRKTILLLNK
jgi:hypothetical protein